MSKDSYGRVPPEAIKQAVMAPHGHAQKTIRKYVPDFTIRSRENVIYDVDIDVAASATIKVAAPSEKEAIELADEYDVSDIDLDVCIRSVETSKKQDVSPDLEWENIGGDHEA